MHFLITHSPTLEKRSETGQNQTSCRTTKPNELPHNKTNQTTFALSKDSDKPWYMPSLIRVLLVHMKKPWILVCPYLSLECTAKVLIRLGRCPGWSESSVVMAQMSWKFIPHIHFISIKDTKSWQNISKVFLFTTDSLFWATCSHITHIKHSDGKEL